MTAKSANRPVVVREVLTIEDAAATLHLSVTHCKRLAARGELPGAYKIGKVWRVNADTFSSWLDALGEGTSPNRALISSDAGSASKPVGVTEDPPLRRAQ